MGCTTLWNLLTKIHNKIDGYTLSRYRRARKQGEDGLGVHLTKPGYSSQEEITPPDKYIAIHSEICSN